MSEQTQLSGRPATTWRAHLLLYAILWLLLLLIFITRYLRPLALADHVPVEPALVGQVEQRIDPNTASWAELARLPGVGESLARRVVDYREAQRRLNPGAAFRYPEDLQRVKGIGPKLLERMTPWLKFPEPAPKRGI